MRFPQEIVVQDFLPTFRALLSQALSEEGLSQEEISGHVGVSQAQVSKYLANKTNLDPTLADDPRVVSTVDTLARGLATGRLDEVSAMARSLELVRRLENRGPLCELHTQRMPALEDTGCDACIEPTGRVMAEHQVLVDLRLALRRLTLLDAFAAWLPHVGSNLAQALEGAQGRWDVAALPGRIDLIGDTPQVTAGPRFGASRHVATVVLAVMDVHPDTRAGLNIAYKPELLDLARDADVEAVAFDAAYDGRQAEVAGRLRERDGGDAPGILYHEGAFGIEPVAYVLGRDAPAAVERLATIIGSQAPGCGG